MMAKRSNHKLLSILLFSSCLLFTIVLVQGKSYSTREGEDEGSCICGLNKEILDQIERIVQTSLSSSCSSKPDVQTVADIPSSPSKPHEEPEQDVKDPKVDNQHPTNNHQTSDSFSIGWPNIHFNFSSSTHDNEAKRPDNGDSSNLSTNTDESPGKATEWSMIAKLTAEIHRLESMLSVGNKPSENQASSGSSTNEEKQEPKSDSDESKTDKQPLVDGGYLGGISISSGGLQNEFKFNTSSQKVDPDEMASTIQSTVPNIVSNIFSNIQNLTLETEKNPNAQKQEPPVLTSIDGNSVSVEGDSKGEITAEGEKLFLHWIEHQIQTLHLTASMAKYIRKNAINLFRKIVKQYVERMEKVGGSLEDNVRRATQMALNNTQNLIAFLLKHYLYFSAGLMQIIGEQVSRIGKQLDSTGDTIAHLSLNPFDIVSKVMDSLPNPSDYSKYFREIGKHLIGDLPWMQQDKNEEKQTSGEQNLEANSTQQQKYGGLFKKTIGALGKTLTSWIG